MCMCVDVCDVCVCGGGGPPWHHVVVNHLLILDSSWRNGSNHSKHTHKHTLMHKCTHLANYAN